MKKLRWLLSLPCAVLSSLVVYLLMMPFLRNAMGGPGVLGVVFGTAPIWLKSAVPTVVFVVVGVLAAPSCSRKVCFVFFGLGLLFSAGGIEMLPYYQDGILIFWLAAAFGVILGSLVGLLISFRIQGLRMNCIMTNDQPTKAAVVS